MAAIFREREEDSAGKGKGLASPNVTLTTGDISDPPVDIFDAIRRWIESIFNPKPTPTPTPAPSISATTVSVEEAETIFQDMADESDIAFKFTPNGCFSRAYLMMQRINQRYHLMPDKVWIFGELNPMVIYGKDLSGNPYYVNWRWHVAPVLNVRMADGSTKQMVIDPSLTSHPITIDQWKNKMNDSRARIEITHPGQPPHRSDGSSYQGSGYWIGPDPTNMDEEAKDRMLRYKFYEDHDINPYLPGSPYRP